MGVSLLVVLTGRGPVDINEACCEACEDINENIRFEDIPADRLAQPGAGWPSAAADGLKQLYVKLALNRRNKRLALPKVLHALCELLQAGGPPEAATPLLLAAAPPDASGGAAAAPSDLSRLVRRMRPADADPVKKNVADAFNSLMHRLGELYRAHDAKAPPRGEFLLRLRFWHEACCLPAGVHNDMQTLRIWRNAADKLDDDRWAREGPRHAEAASQHLFALEAAVDQLFSSQTIQMEGEE